MQLQASIDVVPALTFLSSSVINLKMVGLWLTKAAAAIFVAEAAAASINLPGLKNDAEKPFDGFVSFSIEFSSFTDYAGLSRTSGVHNL